MRIILCPHCNGQLQVEESWHGQTINCPVCSNEFVINIAMIPPAACPPPNSWMSLSLRNAWQNITGKCHSISGNLAENTSSDLPVIMLIISWFMTSNVIYMARILCWINEQIFEKFSYTVIFLSIISLLVSSAALYCAAIKHSKIMIFASAALLLSNIIRTVIACCN